MKQNGKTIFKLLMGIWELIALTLQIFCSKSIFNVHLSNETIGLPRYK